MRWMNRRSDSPASGIFTVDLQYDNFDIEFHAVSADLHQSSIHTMRHN